MKKIYLYSVLMALFIFNMGATHALGEDDFFNIGGSDDSTSSSVNSSSDGSSMNISSDDGEEANTTNVGSTYQSESASKIDASGSLTIKMNEVYNSAVDLKTGNLVINSGASVLQSINVGSGNITIGNDVKVTGNVTSGGNITMGNNVVITGSIKAKGSVKAQDNLEITGGVSASNLNIGDNGTISGPVTLTSASGTNYMGNNSAINNTLTSKAGLSVGFSSVVKLFLSGDIAEVNGTSYKLGGRVTSSGMNTSVGLPAVPKLTNADGSAAKITTSPATTQVQTETKAQTQVQEKTRIQEESEEETSFDDIDEEEAEDTENDFYSGSVSLPDVEDIVDIIDVNSYITEVSNIDTNISELDLSSENVDMSYKVPAKLFGFIPASVQTKVKISKNKNVDVAFPWYSFLFSTPANESAVKDSISNAVKDSFDPSSEALSAKTQATITNNVLNVFKGLFSGK